MLGELENSLQAVFVPQFNPSSVCAALLHFQNLFNHSSWLIPLPLNFAVTEITPVYLNVITQHIAVSSITSSLVRLISCGVLNYLPDWDKFLFQAMLVKFNVVPTLFQGFLIFSVP